MKHSSALLAQPIIACILVTGALCALFLASRFLQQGSSLSTASVVTIGRNRNAIPVKLVRFDDSQTATLDDTSIYMVETRTMDPIVLDQAITAPNGQPAAFFGYQYTDSGATVEKQQRNNPTFAQRFPGRFFASQAARNDAKMGPELATFSQQNGVTFLPTDASDGSVSFEPHALYVFAVAQSGSTISIPLTFSKRTAVNVTTNSLTIKWHTNLPADGQVEYGTMAGSYPNKTPINPFLTTEHAMTISALDPWTTYHGRLRSKTYAGVQGWSQDFTFQTNAFGISNIKIEKNVGSATIEWDTDQPATSQVDYGLDDTYGSGNVINRSGDTHHRIDIPCCRLESGRTYHIKLTSRSTQGGQAVSGNQTLAIPIAERLFISNLTVDPVGEGATISWTTNKKANQILEYGSGGGINQSRAVFSLGTRHTFSLSGLQPDTDYMYRIQSTDEDGLIDRLGADTPLTFRTAPIAIGDVYASTVDNSGRPLLDLRTALVEWNTNPPISCRVTYGLMPDEANWDQTDVSSTPNTMTLTDLILNATYRARLLCPYKTVRSEMFIFRTGNGDPPVISDVHLRLTATGTTVLWTTDRPTNGKILYGPTSIYGYKVAEDTYSYDHSLALPQQQTGTTYTFIIAADDEDGTQTRSPTGCFIAGYPDIWLKNITFSDITDTSAVLQWESSIPTQTYVEYGKDLFFDKVVRSAALTTIHRIVLTGMDTSSVYHVRIRATAPESGVEIVSENMLIGTTDGRPVVSNTRIEEAGSGSVTLSWHTNEPTTSSVDVTPYRSVSRTQTDDVLQKDHRMVFTDLPHNDQFTVRVHATDAQLNTSNLFDPATLSSFATTDDPRVSFSRILHLTETSATIVWRTNRPTTSIVDYATNSQFANGNTISDFALVTNHRTTLTGLLPASGYFYRLMARDSTNALGASPVLQFSTIDRIPPAISGIQTRSNGLGTVTIEWYTNENADSRVYYGSDRLYGNMVQISNSNMNSHSVTLPVLPDGTYHFQVVSIDSSGNVGRSSDSKFVISPY